MYSCHSIVTWSKNFANNLSLSYSVSEYSVVHYVSVQVLDNYGYHYALHDRTERRSHLETQYHFTCVCTACTKDWPSYNLLPNTNPTYLCTRYVFFKDMGHEQKLYHFMLTSFCPLRLMFLTVLLHSTIFLSFANVAKCIYVLMTMWWEPLFA